MTRPHPLAHSLRTGLVAIALGALGCSRPAEQAAVPHPPPPRVEFERADRRPIVDQAELAGRIAATDFVEVRPRISGHIQEVRFQAGQIVAKGEVLFVIDPRWHAAELARAQAQVQSAQVRLATAEKELARAQTLVATRAISGEELEARTGRLHEAQAAAAAASAAAATAQLDLEFTQIRAPIRGRISRPLVTVGNHVSGVAGMTTIMTTLVSVDPVHFLGDLDEASYLRFQAVWAAARQRGERVPLRLAIGDEEQFNRIGEVESLDNQLDMKSGTILLRGVFANPDEQLVPGLYARARLPLGPPREAVLISERAINTDQNQRFVLVVGEGDKAEYRKIRLGGRFDGRREILEGVKATERVIVAGHAAKVRPGLPVQPEPVAEKLSTPNAR